MTILLVGEYYSTNLGDHLLCETVRSCIEEQFPSSAVIPLDISGKIDMENIFPLPICPREGKLRRRLNKYCRKFLSKTSASYRVYLQSSERADRVTQLLQSVLSGNKIDLVVFAGGELFMDYFAGPMAAVLKNTKRIPVIFHACGMHSLSKDSVKVLSPLLRRKNVRSVAMRDSYEKFVRTFGIRKKVTDTFDTALLCGRYFSSHQSSRKVAEFGIGLISSDSLHDLQVHIIRSFIENNASWMVFTNGAEYDYEFARKVMTECGLSEEEITAHLADRPRASNDLISLVTSFERIVSFRMHSQICAMSFGIPAYGIVWDIKVKELFDKLGLTENYSYPNQISDISLLTPSLSIDPDSLKALSYSAGEKSRLCLIKSINYAIGNKVKR